VLWVRAIGEPEVDPVSGALRRIVGTFQDITEPRNAALALAESRERLSTAFWGAGMSLADWRVSTGEINFDANWAATLGYKLEEIKPTLEFWNSLIPKEDQPAIEEAQRKYFEGEVGLFEAEYRMRAKDGTYRWVLERARITEVDLDGRPMRLSGVLVDITSRKSMEEKLAEALQHEQELTRASQAAERAKRNFLAVMSHEIRTPMNSIIGFAEVLTTGKLPPEELEHIRTIKESGEALLRIINDILDYSRIESGRLQLEKIAFSPRETVESVVSMLSNLAAAKGIGLKGGCASDVPRQLVGDPGRLSQILVNLVGNAIKFTPSGSVDLRVEMAPEQGPVARIRFRVVDTGIGISPDKQESIFEPFTQADATISRSHGGTGLGLSISHLLVNLLGGTLHVKSSPGRGSEFYFDIPFGLRTSTERPSAPPPMRPDVSFARKHPLNILVAEDDRVNARLTRLMLEKLGYSPTIVPDGRAAVDAACARPFDLILMDLHMPRMDGIEATLAVRSYEMQTSQTHRTRIVAFTADVLPEERQSCMDAGMDDYLTKPLSLAKLCEALKEAADRVTLSSQLS
jgi:PAS domain S-box-containing protein